MKSLQEILRKMQRLKKEKDLKQDDIATIVSSRTEEVRVMAEQEADEGGKEGAKTGRGRGRVSLTGRGGGGRRRWRRRRRRLSQPGAAEDHETQQCLGEWIRARGARGEEEAGFEDEATGCGSSSEERGKENEEEDWRAEDALDGGAPNAESHSDGEESAPPRFAPKRRAEARQAPAQQDTRGQRESSQEGRRERETLTFATAKTMTTTTTISLRPCRRQPRGRIALEWSGRRKAFAPSSVTRCREAFWLTWGGQSLRGKERTPTQNISQSSRTPVSGRHETWTECIFSFPSLIGMIERDIFGIAPRLASLPAIYSYFQRSAFGIPKKHFDTLLAALLFQDFQQRWLTSNIAACTRRAPLHQHPDCGLDYLAKLRTRSD